MLRNVHSAGKCHIWTSTRDLTMCRGGGDGPHSHLMFCDIKVMVFTTYEETVNLQVRILFELNICCWRGLWSGFIVCLALVKPR